MATTTVLDSDYTEPERPYSTSELSDMRQATHKLVRLGKVRAEHRYECNHFYAVRDNGRKEKKILELNGDDPGNCSVCWRLSKTPRRLRGRAESLVYEYMETFREDPEPSELSHSVVDLEDTFYRWLYLESK